MKKYYRNLYGLSIISVLTGFLILLYFLGAFSNVNSTLTDNLYGGQKPLNNILIVAIDDKSIQEIGRWPWPRENFAKLIDTLNRSAVIAIDVGFFENSNSGNDTELYNALKQSKNVVLTMEYNNFSRFDNGSQEIIRSDTTLGLGYMLPLPSYNLSTLSNINLGYVNVVTDNDGITRSVNMDIEGGYESLALEAYKKYNGENNAKNMEISASILSKIKTSRFLINFVGKPHSFKEYSFSDIINNRIDQKNFDDAIIFVGATAPDLHDDYFVPTSNGKAMPGVEIHANTMQTMIMNKYLTKASNFATILLIILLSLLVYYLLVKLDILWTGIIGAILIIAYVIACIFIFDSGTIMNIVYPPISIILSYIGGTGFLYITEKRQKRKLKEAFSKYVSNKLVDEIVKDPEKLKLGGEKREITVLFSDIADFTSISENLAPEELVRLLNKYLTTMTDIIMKNNGMVDKYIGDAIMAEWNMPLPEKDHAQMACRTALEMIDALEELNKDSALSEVKSRVNLPGAKIHARIGIYTGEAIVGNMGSHERFDYTAIGDTVNTASRMEGLNKVYGTNIMISETTYTQLINHSNSHFKDKLMELDYVRVKGKNKPVIIYELCNKKNTENAVNYSKGLECYRMQKWDDAINEFEKCDTKASRVFIERCEHFKINPPEKDWNGVWIHKEK